MDSSGSVADADACFRTVSAPEIVLIPEEPAVGDVGSRSVGDALDAMPVPGESTVVGDVVHQNYGPSRKWEQRTPVGVHLGVFPRADRIDGLVRCVLFACDAAVEGLGVFVGGRGLII